MGQRLTYHLRNALCVLLITIMLLESSLMALPLYGAANLPRLTTIAVLVDTDVLAVPALQSAIERYAAQLQSQEAQSKVLLIPVEENENPWTITKVLQQLYFQGDNTPGELNQLGGIVLIGNVPMPVVYQGEHTFPSILPYTDFEDPYYVYDVIQERYNRNSRVAAPTAEVLHGVIRPPVAKGTEYYDLLLSYFDKNNAYREGDPRYSTFDQKLFYTDLPKELRTLSEYDIFVYELFLEYWEDISYMRYNKHWFAELFARIDSTHDSISEEDLAAYTEAIGAAPITMEFEERETPNNAALPDGLTRGQIMNYLLSFDNGFSDYFSTVTEHIGGTGRWQAADTDSFFSLIAKRDQVAMQTIRQFNDLFEIAINDQVVRPSAKPFPIITDLDAPRTDSYLYGFKATSISDVSQCSIYNGTLSGASNTVFVEENRTYNFQNADMPCFLVELSDFKGCGSSCAQVDKETGQNLFTPQCRYIEAKLPIVDPKGTREITDIVDPAYRSGHAFCHAVNLPDLKVSNLDSSFCAQHQQHYDLINDGANYKMIPSIKYHVEPTNETLCYHSGGKMENGRCESDTDRPMIPQAMPIDSPRYVDFYMPTTYPWEREVPRGDPFCSGNAPRNTRGQVGYMRIDYPNLFSLSEVGSEAEEVEETIIEFLETKDGDIDYIMKYLTPQGDQRLQGAVTSAWSAIEPHQQKQLIDALLWREMSLQNKYETIFGEQLSPVQYVEEDMEFSYDPRLYNDITPRKPLHGYEVFYLVAEGHDHDIMPLNFTLEPIDSDFKNLNLEKQLPIPQEETFCGEEEFNRYQESLADGRWPKAIQCWLEELTVPTIRFQEWEWDGFEFSFPETTYEDSDKDGLHDGVDPHPNDPDHDKDGLLDGQNALSTIRMETENRMVLLGEPTSSELTATFYDNENRFMPTHSYDQVRFSIENEAHGKLSSTDPLDSYNGRSTVTLYPGTESGITTITATVTQSTTRDISPLFLSEAAQHPDLRISVVDDNGERLTKVPAQSQTLTLDLRLRDPATGGPLTTPQEMHLYLIDKDPAYPKRTEQVFLADSIALEGYESKDPLPLAEGCIVLPNEGEYCGTQLTFTTTGEQETIRFQSTGTSGGLKAILTPVGSDHPYGNNAISTAALTIAQERVIRSQPFEVFTTDKKIDLRSVAVRGDAPLFVDQMRAGGTETLILDATLTDINQNPYPDLTGLPLTFRITHPLSEESPATFFTGAEQTDVVTEITTTVVDGKARATIAGTLTLGEFQVEAFLLTDEHRFYPGRRTMYTFSDAIAAMELSTTSDVIINGKSESRTSLTVYDPFENTIPLPNVDLTVLVEGPITIEPPLPDFDAQREGFQVPAMELEALTVLAADPTANGTGRLTIIYSADVQVQKEFMVIPEGIIDLALSESIIPAGGGGITELTATLRDSDGAVLNTNNTVVSFLIADQSMGQIIRRNIRTVNGVASTLLQSGLSAGTTTITATAYGYTEGSQPLTTVAGPPAKLQFHIAPDTIIPDEGADIEVGVYDAHGNFLSQHSGTSVTIELSEATEHKATLSPESVSITEGRGTFTIVPTETGTLNLLASSGDLERDKVSIKTQFVLNSDYIQELEPQTLYANLFGMPFGDIARENHLGGWWLFGGKTQAVTTMTAPIMEPAVIAKVEPNGSVFLGSAGGESYGRTVRLLQEQDSTLGFEVFDPGYNTSLLKFYYHLTNVELVSATADTALQFDANRFYIHHLRPDTSEMFVESGRHILHANDRDLVSFNADGTITVLDNSIDISTVLEDNLPLQLRFAVGGQELASLTLAFENLPVIEEEATAPAGSHIRVERTSTLTQHQLVPMYFGASTGNNDALALVDVQDRRAIHNHPFRSVDDVLDSGEYSIGFRGDNHHLALFAAGNTVGESTRPFGGEILINLGDPYLTLKPATLLSANRMGLSTIPIMLAGEQYGALITALRSHSPLLNNGLAVGDVLTAVNGQPISATLGLAELLSTVNLHSQQVELTFLQQGVTITKSIPLPAFTQDMGIPILDDSGGEILAIHPMDVNGNGRSDLLIALADGTIRLLEHTGGSTVYQDRGPIHHIPDGIASMSVGEFTGDNLPDIIVPTDQGRFALLRNIGTGFVRSDLELPTRGTIYHAEALDYTGNGTDDLLIADTSGDVHIFPSGQGALGSTSVLLESHPLNATHPLLAPALLQEDLAVYYTDSPAYFPPLQPFIENETLTVSYQAPGETPTDEDNEFIASMTEFAETYEAYPVQISAPAGNQEELLFIPPSIANTGALITEKAVTFTPEFLQKEDSIQVTITLTNNGGNPLTTKVLERRDGLFTLVKDSVTCEHCGPDAVVQSYSPHGAYDLFVDNIVVDPSTPATISYRAVVEGYPELDITTGQFGEANRLSWTPTSLFPWVAHANTGPTNVRIRNPYSPPAPIIPSLTEAAMELFNTEIDTEKDAEEQSKEFEDMLKELFGAYSNDVDCDAIPNGWDPNPYVYTSNGVPVAPGQQFHCNARLLSSFFAQTTTIGDYLIGMANNSMAELDLLAFQVSQGIERSLCSSGSGCLDMPLNYALFAPGKGATDIPSVVLPAFAAPTTWYPAGIPTPGVWPPFWEGTLETAPFESQIRFYISPTLTGSLGMALCLGTHDFGMKELPALGPVTPNANCIVFIMDELLDAMGLKELCDTLTQTLDTAITSARDFVNGNSFGIARFEKNSTGSNSTMEPSKRNIRPTSFPAFLTEWADRQIEEIITKLTKLPNIYIILPDFQMTEPLNQPEFLESTGLPGLTDIAVSTSAAVFAEGEEITTEQRMAALSAGATAAGAEAGAMAHNLQASVDMFYDWLGSLPYLRIDRRPLLLEVPWMDTNAMRASWQDLLNILADALFEFERMKLLLACVPTLPLPPDPDAGSTMVAPDFIGTLSRQTTQAIDSSIASTVRSGREAIEEDGTVAQVRSLGAELLAKEDTPAPSTETPAEAPKAETTVADMIGNMIVEAAAKAQADIENTPRLRALRTEMETTRKQWQRELADQDPEMDMDSLYDEIWELHEEFTALQAQAKANPNDTAISGRLNEVRTELRTKRRAYEAADNATNICLFHPQIAAFTVEYNAFISSISENLQTIERYQAFPAELRSYLQWQDKYMGQIMGYIDLVTNNTIGYIQDNKIIVKRWIQTIGAVQDALGTFQSLLDVFLDYKVQCATCRNDRFNGMQMVVDMMSSFLPEPPIFTFQKWPDIILDVSHIKPITIIIPDIGIQPVPVYFPRINGLSIDLGILEGFMNSLQGLEFMNLSEVLLQNGSITIPELPVLPRPPELPPLPSLPPLPEIELPYLPPAPSIPNMSGSLDMVIKIGGSILNVFCLLTNNQIMIPEWQVRRQIEDLTERTGFLPMDFLKLSWPQVPMPYVDNITISTYVDFKLPGDVIYNLAVEQVESINQWTRKNLTSPMNEELAKVSTDVNNFTAFISNVINTSTQEGVIALGEAIQQLYEPTPSDPTQSAFRATGNINTIMLTLPYGIASTVQVASPNDLYLIPQKNPNGLAITHNDGSSTCVISFADDGTPVQIAGTPGCLSNYRIDLNMQTKQFTISTTPTVNDHTITLTGTGATIDFLNGATQALTIDGPDNLRWYADTLTNRNSIVLEEPTHQSGIALSFNDLNQPVLTPLPRYRDLRNTMTIRLEEDTLIVQPREEITGTSYRIDPRNPYIDVYNNTTNQFTRLFQRIPSTFTVDHTYRNEQSFLRLTRAETGDQVLLTISPQGALSFTSVANRRDVQVSYRVQLVDGFLQVQPRDTIQGYWYILENNQLRLENPEDNSSTTYTLEVDGDYQLSKGNDNGMSHIQVTDTEGRTLHFLFTAAGVLSSWTPAGATAIPDLTPVVEGSTILLTPNAVEEEEAANDLPNEDLVSHIEALHEHPVFAQEFTDPEELRAGYRSARDTLSNYPPSYHLEALYDRLVAMDTPAPELIIPDRAALAQDPALAPTYALLSSLDDDRQRTRAMLQSMPMEDFYSERGERYLAANDLLSTPNTALLASSTEAFPETLAYTEEAPVPTRLVSYEHRRTAFSQEDLLQQRRAAKEAEAEEPLSSHTPTMELEGYYVFDMNRQEGIPLLATTRSTTGGVMTVVDADNDGDEDIIYSMGSRLYLKTNYQNPAPKATYSGRPTYVELVDLLPAYAGVMMPRISNVDSRNATLTFVRTPDRGHRGYEVTLYHTISGMAEERVLGASRRPLPVRYYMLFDEEDRQFFVNELGILTDMVSVVPDRTTLELNISLPNSMYYASVRPIGPDGEGVPSTPLLLPLSRHADRTPPHIRLEGPTTHVLHFSETLTLDASQSTDENTISSFHWDLDDHTDTDQDGNYTNDVDATTTEVTIGPFDHAHTRTLHLTVTDEFRNSSTLPITVHVQPPEIIIEEVSVDTRTLTGRIHPPLADIPVTVGRLRDGSTTVLAPVANAPIQRTDAEGRFTIEELTFEDEILVEEYASDGSARTMATIEGRRGLLTQLHPEATMEVRPTTEESPLTVAIMDSAGDTLATIGYRTSHEGPVTVMNTLPTDSITGVAVSGIHPDIRFSMVPPTPADQRTAVAIQYQGATIALLRKDGALFTTDAFTVTTSIDTTAPHQIFTLTDGGGTPLFSFMIGL